MQKGTYEYQSEFARKHVAQGRKEGREEGLHKGMRGALLTVLDARGLQVEEETRQRILACMERSQLELWLHKSVSVKTAQEIFEPEPAAKPTARKAAKRGRSLKAPKPRSKRSNLPMLQLSGTESSALTVRPHHVERARTRGARAPSSPGPSGR